jgi:hypothetical protein
MFVVRRLVGIVFGAGVLVGLLVVSRGDDGNAPARSPSLRESFETAEPLWQREYTDTTVKLLAQERSERAAHDGRLSERFQFESAPGSQFFVSYATPKVPVSDDLNVSLYVRSDRAGVQLFGRVVLPSDVDPETRAPSFVLVPGTIFDAPERWQRLELAHMIPAIEQRARVLRVLTRRPVRLDGAYLERVVVNLLGGPGSAEVFLDQLEIEPVPRDLLAAWSKAHEPRKAGVDAKGGPEPKRKAIANGTIRLDRNLLEKKRDDGRWYPWLPTAIDAPGANPRELRLRGFKIIVDSLKSDPERLRAAIAMGALLMTRVGGGAAADDPQRLIEDVMNYPLRKDVAFWHVGDHLGRLRSSQRRAAELARIREILTALRGLDDDESHLTMGNVDGEVPLFARAPSGLDMIGIAPHLWGAALEPMESYAYFNQRKLLTVRANLGGLFWAWIPASCPPEVVKNIWGYDTPPPWGTPPVQPTQLRLMTYLALAAGYRGLGFTGDADLTRPGGLGRALLIEMSFLNLEIDLVEHILAGNENKIRDYNVFDLAPLPVPANAAQLPLRRPMVKELTPRIGMLASAIPLVDRKGALLLVADYAYSAQYQPPQLSLDEVTVTPALPEGAQAFEITPGDVKVLNLERTVGGRQITMTEFDTTCMILCTGDLRIYEQLRRIVEGIRPKAVPLAIEQAEILLQAVTETNGRLAADGHEFISKVDLKRRQQAGIEGDPPDVPDLLAESQKYIQSAREAQERQDYAGAWAEARRASRPLRIVMHGHWVQANAALAKAAKTFYPKRPGEEEDDDLAAITPKKKSNAPKLPKRPPLLVMPISCPPCVSYFTLPEHYIWVDWIKGRPGYRFGRNRVPSGDFENPRAISEAGWVDVSYETEGLLAKVSTAPREEPVAKKAESKDAKKKENPPPERSASKRVIKLEVKPAHPEELDTTLSPILDFPVAAIRSPPIAVEANNFIRISVLAKRAFPSAQGVGGVIVRDSIGGEQLQFRTSNPIPEYSRVLLFRKAPADGNFTVTLGLAGYGEAYFDDFRVEVIERDPGFAAPDVAQNRRRGQPLQAPALPNPALPAAAARPTDSRRQQR